MTKFDTMSNFRKRHSFIKDAELQRNFFFMSNNLSKRDFYHNSTHSEINSLFFISEYKSHKRFKLLSNDNNKISFNNPQVCLTEDEKDILDVLRPSNDAFMNDTMTGSELNRFANLLYKFKDMLSLSDNFIEGLVSDYEHQ